MSPFTASGAQRVSQCLGSVVLPQTRTTIPGNKKGNAVHAFIPAVGKIGRDAAIEATPKKYRALVEEIEIDKLPVDPATCAHEIAMVYDVATDKAREISRGCDKRNYGELLPSEIPGTMDVLGLIGDDAVYVADFKSGWAEVPEAKENYQLKLYALMACRALNRSRAVIQVIKIGDSGEVTPLAPYEMDCFELDEFSEDMFQLHHSALVNKAEHERSGMLPILHQGDHCTFCPAIPHCPAKMSLIRAVAGEALEMQEPGAQLPTLTSPEQAAEAWTRLKAAKKLLVMLEAAVKEYARHTPVPLPNGKTLREVEKLGNEKLDGPAVFEAVAVTYGPKAAAEAVEMKATKGRAKAMLRNWKPVGMTLADAERELFKELRESGAATRETITTVTEAKTK